MLFVTTSNTMTRQLLLLFLLPIISLQGTERRNFNRENIVPWCIVPFDASERSPDERAKMLVRLGLKRSAYDWRAQHVKSLKRKFFSIKNTGLNSSPFWNVHEKAFELFQKHKIHPQIWKTLALPQVRYPGRKDQIAKEAMTPLAKATAEIGCKLGLYNHGGWGGEPENLVTVCKALRAEGHDHVGIVYNWHHGTTGSKNGNKTSTSCYPTCTA
jgi:hypothetical protein